MGSKTYLRGGFRARANDFGARIGLAAPGTVTISKGKVRKMYYVLPILTANTHGTKNWRRNSKPRGAQLNILDLGGIRAALQRGGNGWSRHFLAAENL